MLLRLKKAIPNNFINHSLVDFKFSNAMELINSPANEAHVLLFSIIGLFSEGCSRGCCKESMLSRLEKHIIFLPKLFQPWCSD